MSYKIQVLFLVNSSHFEALFLRELNKIKVIRLLILLK